MTLSVLWLSVLVALAVVGAWVVAFLAALMGSYLWHKARQALRTGIYLKWVAIIPAGAPEFRCQTFDGRLETRGPYPC